MTKRNWLTGVVLAIVTCSDANRAFAQQGWAGAMTNISEPDQSSYGRAELAMDPHGNAVAVFQRDGRGVLAARYDADTRQWAAPALISSPAESGGGRVGLDSHGNAIVIWDARIDYVATAIRASRYDVGAGVWSSPVDLTSSAPLAHRHALAVHGSGDAMAVWFAGSPATVQASRYDALTGAWSGPTLVAAAGVEPTALAVGADRAGNVMAVWTWLDGAIRVIRVARYLVASGAWTAATDFAAAMGEVGLAVDQQGYATLVWVRSGDVVATRLSIVSGMIGTVVALAPASLYTTRPLVRVDAVGNAAAVWRSDWGQFATARYSATTGNWSASTALPAYGALGSFDLALDGAGNATLVWEVFVDRDLIGAARYSVATGRWGDARPLSSLQAFSFTPSVAANAAGQVVAVWWLEQQPHRIQATNWLASPNAPTVTNVTGGGGALAVSMTPPVTPEPVFAPTTYEYSLDDGATWTPRTPASTVSPLRISGLTNDITYPVRLRAVNGAGPGAPSASVAATPRAAPDPPMNLGVATQAGNTVTLAWTAPTAGLPPTAYVLEGGVQPGEVLASIPAGGPMPVPSFTLSVPTGAYYVRMHAVAGTAWSPPSNEIRLFINVPVPPAAPTNLLGLANGSALALSWTNPPGGGAPTALWLNVTGSLTIALPLAATETFAYPAVPPGTYTFTVSASNAGGMSAPSSHVTLSFPSPCTGVPGPPTTLQAWTTGRTIFLTWGAPVGGAAVTGYTVHVSGVYVGSFATTSRALSGVAASGSYTLSVVATNPCGASPATPAQTVVVP